MVVLQVQSKIRIRRQSNDPVWHMDHGMQLIGQGLTEMMTGEKAPADLYSTQYEPYNPPPSTMSPTQRYFNNFQNPFDFLFNAR